MRCVEKLFIVRFDIDTHVCAIRGIPALLHLAGQEQVQFSFFINMGQAVSRRDSFRELCFNKCPSFPQKYKLPIREKIGLLGYMVSASMNPLVGKKNNDLLHEIETAGHDLGLHGGRNHALWQRHAGSWSMERLRDEIGWGVHQLKEIGIGRIQSFASPGWNSPENLPKILTEFDIKIIADQHGTHLHQVQRLPGFRDLISVPTNLLGEPGGIGYIEYLRARYQSDEKMLQAFEDDLNKHPQLAVMYDHPAYVGRLEIDFLRKLITRARQHGYTIVTLREAAEKSAV